MNYEMNMTLYLPENEIYLKISVCAGANYSSLPTFLVQAERWCKPSEHTLSSTYAYYCLSLAGHQ